MRLGQNPRPQHARPQRRSGGAGLDRNQIKRQVRVQRHLPVQKRGPGCDRHQVLGMKVHRPGKIGYGEQGARSAQRRRITGPGFRDPTIGRSAQHLRQPDPSPIRPE
jgi:hypothetical protein